MYRKPKMKKIIHAVIGAAILTGCAPKLGGSDYDVRGVGEVSKTMPGVILAKRVVKINAADPTQPGIGAGGGAAAGVLGGSMIGQGDGNLLAMGLGALIGGFAGHALEQEATSQEGFEYQVRLENGSTIALSQGAEPSLCVGQAVFVIEGIKGRSRIVAR